MSLRIRQDGRILCAAMHDAEPGDFYIGDDGHYELSAVTGVLVTEPMESTVGRGGHAKHGEWWWITDIPADAVVDERRWIEGRDEFIGSERLTDGNS